MAARKTAGGGKGQDKVWSDAIRLAAFRKSDNGERYIALAAQKLVQCAVDGDVSAMKEIGDRLEGKPVQPTDNRHTGELTVEIVRFAAAKAS